MLKLWRTPKARRDPTGESFNPTSKLASGSPKGNQRDDNVANDRRRAELLAAMLRRYVIQIEYPLTSTRVDEVVNHFDNMKVKEQE
jgi:hypothetical protein